VGNFLTAELGGPHDAVLLFQVLHHLSPAQSVALLRRVRTALGRKGTLAVMEYLREDVEEPASAAPLLGLHYYLTSRAAAYSPAELEGFLGDAGFTIVRTQPIRHLPLQTLVIARPE
jgi:2-polyprenyl-3-methyl-5-hydroxy-6-metoxy-1,4-benzoquinol methylase